MRLLLFCLLALSSGCVSGSPRHGSDTGGPDSGGPDTSPDAADAVDGTGATDTGVATDAADETVGVDPDTADDTGVISVDTVPAGTTCEDDNDCTAEATACTEPFCDRESGFCSVRTRPNGATCEDAPALGGAGVTSGVCKTGECRRLPVVVAGGWHACALMPDDSMRCWGRNDAGQLGLGHALDVGSGTGPTVATAGAVRLTGVTAFALGTAQTCAISDGELRCWGFNANGQLGYDDQVSRGLTADTTPDRLEPVELGDDFDIVSVATRNGGSCAVARGGGVKCWGYLPQCYPDVLRVGTGQEGAPTVAEIGLVQLAEPGEEFPVSAVARGGDHVCALSLGGSVRCWGHVLRLGGGADQRIGDDEPPSDSPLVNTSWSAASLSALDAHTCAVATNGAIYCWGVNDSGQAGVAEVSYFGVVGPILFPGGALARKVGAGASHTCALLTNGEVRCWGDNALGKKLGRGDDLSPRIAQEAVTVDLGGPAHDIAVGGNFTCAVMRDGAVRCFGDGANGALGNGSTEIIGDEASDMPPAAIVF